MCFVKLYFALNRKFLQIEYFWRLNSSIWQQPVPRVWSVKLMKQGCLIATWRQCRKVNSDPALLAHMQTLSLAHYSCGALQRCLP